MDLDQDQKNFLLELFKISRGSNTTMVNIHEIQKKTGLEFPDINVVITHLKKLKLIEHAEMGDMVAITHSGIKFAGEQNK